MVGRWDTGCLGWHTHTPQESLPPQGLDDKVLVRSLAREFPKPLQARTYLQEAGIFCCWGRHGWDVQLKPRGLLALQTASAVSSDLTHGSRCRGQAWEKEFC